MWRCLLIAAALYACGYPGFDYRPPAFDRSLREFHRDVNRTVSEVTHAVTGLDQARALRQLHALGGQLQGMLPRP
jgi:hypothetical protein